MFGITIATLATTVYGKIGSDWVRMTLARVTVDGIANIAWIRADGSQAVVRTLPATYRTSGDVATMASRIGLPVDMACIPARLLEAHAWKPDYTLAALAKHSAQGPALKANIKALKATYAEIRAEQKAA
jgi:hypothetical protein